MDSTSLEIWHSNCKKYDKCRRTTIWFYRTWSPNRASYLRFFRFLEIYSKQDSYYSEELHMDYGGLYHFTGERCKKKQFIQIIVRVIPEPLCFNELFRYREHNRNTCPRA